MAAKPSPSRLWVQTLPTSSRPSPRVVVGRYADCLRLPLRGAQPGLQRRVTGCGIFTSRVPRSQSCSRAAHNNGRLVLASTADVGLHFTHTALAHVPVQPFDLIPRPIGFRHYRDTARYARYRATPGL